MTRFQTVAQSTCFTATETPQGCSNYTDPDPSGRFDVLKFWPQPQTCTSGCSGTSCFGGWPLLGDTCESRCHYGYSVDPASDGSAVTFQCVFKNDTMILARTSVRDPTGATSTYVNAPCSSLSGCSEATSYWETNQASTKRYVFNRDDLRYLGENFKCKPKLCTIGASPNFDTFTSNAQDMVNVHYLERSEPLRSMV